MLSSYLKSISDEYEITFRTDPNRKWMIVTIRKDFLYKEVIINYVNLSDEEFVTDCIRNVVNRFAEVTWLRTKSAN